MAGQLETEARLRHLWTALHGRRGHISPSGVRLRRKSADRMPWGRRIARLLFGSCELCHLLGSGPAFYGNGWTMGNVRHLTVHAVHPLRRRLLNGRPN